MHPLPDDSLPARICTGKFPDACTIATISLSFMAATLARPEATR